MFNQLFLPPYHSISLGRLANLDDKNEHGVAAMHDDQISMQLGSGNFLPHVMYDKSGPLLVNAAWEHAFRK